jgi:hypothetical protein
MVSSRSRARWAMEAAAIVALLGGCGDGGPLGDSPTISGQVQSWTLGATALDVSLDSAHETSDATVTSGTVDATGHFSVTLPGAAAVASSLAATDFSMGYSGCDPSTSVTLSPPTVLSASAQLNVSSTTKNSGGTFTSEGELTLGATAPAATGQYTLSVVYSYFDEDATASGTLLCGPEIITVNVDVSKGWNSLRVVSLGDQTDVSSGPPPSAAAWTSSLTTCTSDADCSQEPCDLTLGVCWPCVDSGDQADSSNDCCNPTSAGTGAVVCD